MGDLLYPDNPKRERRAEELADDIGNLSNDLANDAVGIKKTLEELDKIIRDMYKDIQVEIPPDTTKKVNYHGWVVEVVEGIAPFIVFPIASVALETAAVSWLLSEGLIGEAALVELVGLPTWLSIGVVAGGLIVAVGVDLIIEGIAGAEKRTKLRRAIHSAIQPRIKMKKASLINDALQSKLMAVKDSFNMMRELGYGKEQLDEAQKNIADQFKEEVSKINDSTAQEDLASLDKERGSWTNEDN